MNNFEESLNSLKEELFNLEEVKAYFKLKNEIENNEELISLTKEISHLQRMMTLNIDDYEKHLDYKTQYEICLKKYNNHPIIVNFENVKEEVYQILTSIKTIIEK